MYSLLLLSPYMSLGRVGLKHQYSTNSIFERVRDFATRVEINENVEYCL